MTVPERHAVLAFLKANTSNERADIATQRAQLDSLADFFPVQDGVDVSPATLGGIDGEWVRAPGVRDDAVLLYLHGGGYISGSPNSHRHLIAALSAATGMSAFAPHYRLAPEHPYPAAVLDAVAVYHAITQSGMPTTRIAIAGDSAGGGLTIATLLALRGAGVAMPACAAVLSPWVDLTQSGDAYHDRAERDPLITKAELDECTHSYIGGANVSSPLASPVFADLNGLPPLLIQVGTEEALYSDAETLYANAQKAGLDVSFEAWGGMIHVWHVFHPILSEGRDAIARVGSFIKDHIA